MNEYVWYVAASIGGFLLKFFFDWLVTGSKEKNKDIHDIRLTVVKLEGKLDAIAIQMTSVTRAIDDVSMLHGKVREINKELEIRFGREA